jgi:hypothetical protein
MSTTQELINRINLRGLLESDRAEIAEKLTRLSAIESAGGDVAAIERAHQARATCIASRREAAESGASESERLWALNDAEEMDTPEHRDRGTLLALLRHRDLEKQGLTTLVNTYRDADCPFAVPERIREAERKHGHLATREGAGK